MTVTLGKELIPLITPIIKLLDTHDPVTQQKIIELLVWRHCERLPGQEDFVLTSMVKHIRQFRGKKSYQELLTGGGKTGE
jgi:hypothetical protein